MATRVPRYRRFPKTLPFSNSIYKVLKQVHPDNGLSAEARHMLNSIVVELLRELSESIDRLLTGSGRRTITSLEAQNAVRIRLGGSDLLQHAVSEGTKAVTKYNQGLPTKEERAQAKLARGGGRRRAGESHSKSFRSGLQFPISRVARIIRARAPNGTRMSVTAGVYLTGVVEYIIAEVLSLGGNATKDLKKKRITPRHLFLAIHGDSGLEALSRRWVLQGGVVPMIPTALLKKKGRAQRAEEEGED